MALKRAARRGGTVLALMTVPMTFLAGFMFLEAALAPKAELWPRFQAHDASSTARIDHRQWDGFLKAYLRTGADGVYRMAYRRVTEADKKVLNGYLARLGSTPIERFNRAQQLAYWINLYNALTVRLVLQFYPVDSIRDIDVSTGLFGGANLFSGVWDRKLMEVSGQPMSLNDIEHRILRPIWRDARIHYAVNCASIGCPDLRPVAFTADNTEALLDKAARAYVNHPRGVRIADGKLTASKIYGWFEDDFGDTEKAVIRHLRRYADPALAKALDGFDGIDDYVYDWRLNDSGS